MIFTTFQSRRLALLLDEPDWSQRPALTMTLAAAVDQALSGRENRRPAHALPRWSLSLRYTLDRAATLAWQEGALALERDTLLAVPLPFDNADSPDRILAPQLALAWDGSAAPPAAGAGGAGGAGGFLLVIAADLAAGALQECGIGNAECGMPDASVSSDGLSNSAFRNPHSAFQHLVPLLVGRLKTRPELTALNDRECRFSIELEDASPDWCSLAPALPEAESPVSVDWPAALSANWREQPTDAIEDLSTADTIGAGREPLIDDDSAPWRAQKFLLTLENRAQIRALLNFFAARKGPVQSWVVPWLLAPAENPDNPAAPHFTRCRFASDSLKLTFQSDHIAEAAIEVVQLPWEISLNEGEQPEQPPIAHLYRLTADLPDGPVAWRFTDWESALDRDEPAPVTYAPARIAHDAVTRDIALDDDEVTLTATLDDAGSAAGPAATQHPLALVVRRALDCPLRLEILRCDPAAPATAAELFSGTIADVTLEGRKLTATATLLGGKLEVKVPRFYFSKTCNHTFGGFGCGLAPQTADATITAVADTTHLAITLAGAPAAIDLSQPGALAGAWFSIGAGLTLQLRAIAADEGTGTDRVITLTRALRDTAALAGAPVILRLACDKTMAGCARWGNAPNFGGHPQMGPQNLSIPTRETSAAGGKK
jgi:hypothetical protein